MKKLIDLLNENQNIKRDPNYWIKEFNILGVIQQFNTQFFQKRGQNFYGLLNFLIFDRKDLKEIEGKINTSLFLSGFLPKGKNEFWDEDFLITLDQIYSKNKLISQLNSVKDKVYLLQIECSIHPQTKETVVSVNYHWN